MDILLILGSLFAVYIIGISVMQKADQKHLNNGKSIERTLINNHQEDQNHDC